MERKMTEPRLVKCYNLMEYMEKKYPEHKEDIQGISVLLRNLDVKINHPKPSRLM